ncbi:Protein of unknown function [Dethiosulfatibacter aminovorans DSM 17477]|uniref:Putative Se/S carrier protein-like domain-containing protein n=1 Tax=Dethiosulfatibacter aminovorans DSM 17477 TaxID=1121476 RepID=A0A1M6FAR3_9FIRM|nr:DUF3343 domain-containing protein [Dethiosulfatibacter aminovorans]SHI94780.1 Protein of unknown function [Dethiosulfatibacter aminovorans DSM 17477]
MDKYCVMTFKSVSYSIKFEKRMKENGMDVKLIPVPRSISASCGMCGRFECSQRDEIERICGENKIQYEGIYEFMK